MGYMKSCTRRAMMGKLKNGTPPPHASQPPGAKQHSNGEQEECPINGIVSSQFAKVQRRRRQVGGQRKAQCRIQIDAQREQRAEDNEQGSAANRFILTGEPRPPASKSGAAWHDSRKCSWCSSRCRRCWWANTHPGDGWRVLSPE